MKKSCSLFILLFFILNISLKAQRLPEIGAQVWIEPGDTDQQIDSWLKTLADNNMKTARIFIIWNYIESEPGKWDFSLYDKVFDAAKKYNIHIIATFETNRKSAHRGDFYQLHGTDLEATEERLEESKIYIEKVVNHWKDHPNLESWMLTNEALFKPTNDPLVIERYRIWLKEKYKDIKVLNKEWSTWFHTFDEIVPNEAWVESGYWNLQPAFIDFTTFGRVHLTWWLNWIANEIRKHDSVTPLHAHSEGITCNMASKSYDFPAWQEISNSLGATIHPSWAFRYFNRNEFPLGISIICEIMRYASSPNPYWVTELQAGQNIFSGRPHPLTPTANDISQWTWTSIMNDADKVVYWMLNGRSKGFEVNEWSMLDFFSRPTERLTMAGKIAKTLQDNEKLFSNAKKLNAPVTILMSLETMTLELYNPDKTRLARSDDAHTMSFYGYYKAFAALGVPVNLSFMDDFEWTTVKNQIAIIPHALALTEEQAKNITTFVRNGNRLLVSGLTGLTDESSGSWVQKNWPLREVMGANFKDCRLIGDTLSINWNNELTLPAVFWAGEIELDKATPMGYQDGRVAASKNKYGNGEAIFIPTTLGLGAWSIDSAPLAKLLEILFPDVLNNFPVRFASHNNNMLVQTMKSGKDIIVMVTNAKLTEETVDLRLNGNKPVILWGSDRQFNNGKVKLAGRETLVFKIEE